MITISADLFCLLRESLNEYVDNDSEADPEVVEAVRDARRYEYDNDGKAL
jgi:hypothetical protein